MTEFRPLSLGQTENGPFDYVPLWTFLHNTFFLSTFSIWLLQMTSEEGWGGVGVANQTHAAFDL